MASSSASSQPQTLVFRTHPKEYCDYIYGKICRVGANFDWESEPFEKKRVAAQIFERATRLDWCSFFDKPSNSDRVVTMENAMTEIVAAGKPI